MLLVGYINFKGTKATMNVEKIINDIDNQCVYDGRNPEVLVNNFIHGFVSYVKSDKRMAYWEEELDLADDYVFGVLDKATDRVKMAKMALDTRIKEYKNAIRFFEERMDIHV